MFLFICTAVLAALFLGAKLTKDIFPRPLKLWLLKKAISNWMRSQPQKFGREFKKLQEKKTIEDVGAVATEDEFLVEQPVHITSSFLREEYSIYGTGDGGQAIFVKLTRLPENWSQCDILLKIKDESYHACMQGEIGSQKEFSLGNFKIELVEPFRTWRIWYNGLMTKKSKSKDKSEARLVHVVLNFLWKALDNPIDSRKNGNQDLLANHFCSIGLFGQNLPSLLKVLPEGYSQFGTLHGIANIGKQEGPEEHELYLYGFRRRDVLNTLEANRALDIFPVIGKKDKATLKNDETTRFEIFGMNESGSGFRLVGCNGNWTDGALLWPSYKANPVVHVDSSPAAILSNMRSSTLVNISDCEATLRVEIVQSSKTKIFARNTQFTHLTLRINGEEATGVLIKTLESEQIKILNKNGRKQVDQRGVEKYPLIVEDYFGDDSTAAVTSAQSKESVGLHYVVDFSHPACLKVPLVGGKGASLARLYNLRERLTKSEVNTARGFCVTTNLFRESLKLEEFADIFQQASTSSDSGNNKITLEDACSKVMQMIKSCKNSEEISDLISHQLKKVFGASRENVRFAVRSSGVLEDGADLSCAGQNETFLGVPESLVTQRVFDCWASLFTEQSVRYRLNHGQPAVSEMAVVVQELVDASSAGVIFTADPRTGNPFEMIVTANYGLGESVVSGSCDPDTITLIRREQSLSDAVDYGDLYVAPFKSKWWSSIQVGKKTLGEKKVKIISKLSDSEATTEEVSIPDHESKEFCVDESTALKLGYAAAQIEQLMGQLKPVDIEWAVDKNGRIFILQCRSLTALDSWTDFEILHELDSPIRNKTDLFTTANAGEVLPKAMHTISQIMNRMLDVSTQEQACLRKGSSWAISPYRCNHTPLFKQRLFINLYQTLYSTVDKEITSASVCIDQTVFGRQVITEEMRQTAEKRFGLASGPGKIKDLYLTFKSFWEVGSIVEKTDKAYSKFKLDYTKVPKTAEDVYNQMSQDLMHLHETGSAHLVTSSSGSVTQVFLFMFLSQGKKPSEWDSSMYEDASKLLSACSNVESAELPTDINQLLDDIIKHGGEEASIKEGFLDQKSPIKALEWIRSNEQLGQALDRFFEKHGHRGVCEMDIGEPSWVNDPASFLPILQSTLKTKLSEKDKKTDNSQRNQQSSFKNYDELLDSLASDLKPMTRRFLKLILPTCRNAVVYREKTKSLFVRVTHQFKEKYNYLSQIMVQENLLPSENLIYHLNHFEIGQLIKKDASSSVIIQKAMKRSKLYKHIEKLEFPEICKGMPQEMDTSIPVEITDTIQATPVSRGVARGVAKVCLSVEEASENLQAGDILITHGTDIAWSPFFPILGGVVTELGGLISHGAVVAREYGLPCIVGAVNATKIFKTGDRVILDAGKGTLSKTLE